jgi:hypothetical protein
MPYTKLASYQFERGKGFTEESVFAFHTLALEAIYELARNDRSSTATFPLSDDEVQPRGRSGGSAAGDLGADAHVRLPRGPSDSRPRPIRDRRSVRRRD